MAEKKYQVFLSSTYTDLIEERQKVLGILLSADCIPAGMEAFVATDDEQFEVIKKVIDLCDYYILIIGKRYGSVNQATGISYTEMEYNYAIEKAIPVLAFVLDESVTLPDAKVENDPIKKEKLKNFRDKATGNRLASIWKTSDELVGKLAVAIMKAKSEIGRPGWQRAVNYDETSLLKEIMNLRSSNDELAEWNHDLKEELEDAYKKIESLTSQSDVAFEDCMIQIEYKYISYSYPSSYTKYGEIKKSLSDIFAAIALQMLDVSINENSITSVITQQLIEETKSATLTDSLLVKRIMNQLKALKLVFSKWNEDNKVLYWGLTEKGIKLRDDMTIVKKTS